MDAPDDVKKILGPSEEVELYIRQKIYHPKFNIESVVITNMRIILRAPHALGILKNYEDYSYQNIANIVLDKGLLRSKLKFDLLFGGEPLILEDLPNSDAEKAYGIIRENLTRLQSGYGFVPGTKSPSGARAAEPVCPKCGASMSPGQKFCGSCGRKI
jgi:hypothetical protein